jgi:hypothetical protein
MAADYSNNIFGGRESGHLYGHKDKSKGVYLEFYHVYSKQSVRFKAFLQTYSDSFKCNFNKEATYGRSDPFYVYQNTTRAINLGWDIPAFDLAEAKLNLKKCSFLISMLYPIYEKTVGTRNSAALSGAPIVRVKFANLIKNTKNAASGFTGTQASEDGLACALQGMNFQPVIDQGFFADKEGNGAPTLYPKLIQLSCVADVIHEHALGWEKQAGMEDYVRPGMSHYPYGLENKTTSVAALISESDAASILGGGSSDADEESEEAASALKPPDGPTAIAQSAASNMFV